MWTKRTRAAFIRSSAPRTARRTTSRRPRPDYLDLAGNVTQIVYPTGRTVNYTHNSANRPSSATDASNGITYVADWQTPPANTNCTAGAVCYTPQGSVYGMSIGQSSSFTGFNVLETFNSRLQPSEIKASRLQQPKQSTRRHFWRRMVHQYPIYRAFESQWFRWAVQHKHRKLLHFFARRRDRLDDNRHLHRFELRCPRRKTEPLITTRFRVPPTAGP